MNTRDVEHDALIAAVLAGLAARGITPQCITWFGLRSDAAEYVDATLAKARQKYGDVLSHTVTSTNGSAQ